MRRTGMMLIAGIGIFVALAVASTASAASQGCSFKKTVRHGGTAFDISSHPADGCEIQIIEVIARRGGKRVARLKADVDFLAENAWAADLTGEGKPALVVSSRSLRGGGRGTVDVYWLEGDLLRRSTMPQREEGAGYQGHDSFRLEGRVIVRSFPIYRNDDPESSPGGGTRTLLYVFGSGKLALNVKFDQPTAISSVVMKPTATASIKGKPTVAKSRSAKSPATRPAPAAAPVVAQSPVVEAKPTPAPTATPSAVEPAPKAEPAAAEPPVAESVVIPTPIAKPAAKSTAIAETTIIESPAIEPAAAPSPVAEPPAAIPPVATPADAASRVAKRATRKPSSKPLSEDDVYPVAAPPGFFPPEAPKTEKRPAVRPPKPASFKPAPSDDVYPRAAPPEFYMSEAAKASEQAPSEAAASGPAYAQAGGRPAIKAIVAGPSYIEIQATGPLAEFKTIKSDKARKLTIEISGASPGTAIKWVTIDKFNISRASAKTVSGKVRVILESSRTVFPVHTITATENGLRIGF